VDVKRLAAVDMRGMHGAVRRRRVILAEFIGGAIGITVVGTSLTASASSAGGMVFGLWVLGMGLNYVPLAVYAIRLARPGALDAELASVDVPRELRRYSLLQLWILVPLSLVALTASRLTR
jgi:hypothetical protein